MSAFSSTQALLEQPPRGHSTQSTPISILATVLEGFPNGVLLLNTRGDCLQTNRKGRQICHLLSPNHAIPPIIWSFCEKLIEGRSLLPEHLLVLDDTLSTATGLTFAIQVQWMEFGPQDEACLLVMIQDQDHAAKVSALLESRRFNLTPRETEVWLLRKANFTYSEIAKRLFIALNTVKRHVKSINAKRKQVLEE